MKETAKKLNEIIEHATFTERELAPFKSGQYPDGAIISKGIIKTFAFHPGRLEEKRDEVRAIITKMKPAFFTDVSGGASFLHLPKDKDDQEWGNDKDAEKLVCLAQALRLGGIGTPRADWKFQQGNVPYIFFTPAARLDK